MRQRDARALIHQIDPRDNVAVALADLPAGSTVQVADETVTVQDAIPFGHKLALARIPPGAPVIKYGEQIGLASRPIVPGEHVHVHNVESTRGRGDLAGRPETLGAPKAPLPSSAVTGEGQ